MKHNVFKVIAMLALCAFCGEAQSNGQSITIESASADVIDLCHDPLLTYEARISQGEISFLKLIEVVKAQGDEGDTDRLVKAYEAYAELFATYDANSKRDVANRKFLSKLDLSESIDFNCFLFLVGSYIESYDIDAQTAIPAYGYQDNAEAGLVFVADAKVNLSKLDPYDQARYYAMLGTLQMFGKKIDDALSSYAKATALMGEKYGTTSAEYYCYRMFEETALAYKGDFAAALNMAKQTETGLKGFSKHLSAMGVTLHGEDYVEYASLLARMAEYCKKLGDGEGELKYNERALDAIYDRYGSTNYIFKPYMEYCLPTNGPMLYLWRSVFVVKQALAENYFMHGQVEKSRKMFIELLKDYKNEANSSKGYADLNIDKIKMMMEPLSTLAPLLVLRFPEDASLSGLAYDCTLQYKNFSLYADNLIEKMVRMDRNPDVKDIYELIEENKKKLGANQELDVKLREINRQLTQQLLVELDFSTFGSLMKVNWQGVQDFLPNDGAAIEFMVCKTSEGETIYLACVLKSGGAPSVVELCTEKQLKAIADPYSSSDAYNLIWTPLAQLLEGVKNIYFSPAGRFYNLSIESLPDPSGAIIGEQFNMFRLSSTRVLAEHAASGRIDHCVLYGGVKFNDKQQPVDAAPSSRSGLHYLPQTLVEMNNVGNILKPTACNIDTYSSDVATEESFKMLSGKKVDILHIATHGFYWTERNAKHLKLPFLIKGKHTTAEDRAMTRSGLFLAGANQVMSGAAVDNGVEDGVLTSREIACLDLSNVDMAVLSACQTGLGETDTDGVYGLQRGFKKAGVKSLVMSLWKVDDEATQLLMTHFYKNLAVGKSKRDAFVSAQTTLRTQDNGKFRDPRFWAAFILLDAI